MTSAEITDILKDPPSAAEDAMLSQFSRIDSLVSRDEALALYRLCMLTPDNKRALEIGSYRGGSTVALGHAARAKDLHLYCLDMWAAYREQSDFCNMEQSTLDDYEIFTDFIHNTSFVKDRVSMLRGSGSDFVDILCKNSFSFVFIDGAHDYHSVINDINLSLKVIEPGGILCGHDYHSAGTDVIKAVHDVIIQSETIAVKGLIGKTSVWFAVIEDPEYEYLIASTIRHMAKADFQSAYETLTSGMETVRKTTELHRILNGLESELGLRPSQLVSR